MASSTSTSTSTTSVNSGAEVNAGAGDQDPMDIEDEEPPTPNLEKAPSTSSSCQYPVLEDKSVSVKKSMLDAILKENRDLKQLLGKKDEEIKKIKGSYRRAKSMFGKEWGSRKIQWNMKRLHLRELKKEEKELEKTAGELKEVMGEANLDLWRKEEQFQELTKKVAELKDGSLPLRTPTPRYLKVTAAAGMTSSGRKEAVLLLPEEVWTMILGNVLDPKDLWNLCNTCQLFEDILRPWKTGWMLEQALPYLYRHLPKEKIPDCLLVSRGWYSGIHNFFENHPSLRPHDPRSDPRRLDFINPVMELKLQNQFVFNYQRSTPTPLKNVDPELPLPRWMRKGRYACLTLGENMEDPDPDMDEEEYGKVLWDKVINFLTSFGEQIMYLSLYFSADLLNADTEQQGFLQLISGQLFSLVPNLRKLRLGGETYFGGWENADIDPVSLPPAPLLESLELDAIEEDGHDPIVHGLLARYHLQLRKLTLTATALKFTLAQLDWPELQELHLSQVITDKDFRGLADLRMPKLAKLGLDLSECDTFFFKFDSLLELIGSLSSTTCLSTIRLDKLKRRRLGQPEVATKLYSPVTLKTLEIQLSHWRLTPSYDFLLRCFPLLENLHIFLKGDFYGIELQSEIGLCNPEMTQEFLEAKAGELQLEGEILEVNKYIFTGQMYKSNIWRLLPKLKVFSFQWDVCTRADYEAYNEKIGRGSSARR